MEANEIVQLINQKYNWATNVEVLDYMPSPEFYEACVESGVNPLEIKILRGILSGKKSFSVKISPRSIKPEDVFHVMGEAKAEMDRQLRRENV